jgi:Protein of unknown function (DUF2442)
MAILNTVINEGERPVSATCDDDFLIVALADGRRIVTPLWWYPRLLKATPEQRAKVELSRFGLHWEEIDEDLSIDGMLRGAKAPGAVPPPRDFPHL